MKMVTAMQESALENAKKGRPVQAFAAVVAAWVRYLVGKY
jgi:mannitol-1-phosphate/altronate dehydrogenase